MHKKVLTASINLVKKINSQIFGINFFCHAKAEKKSIKCRVTCTSKKCYAKNSVLILIKSKILLSKIY